MKNFCYFEKQAISCTASILLKATTCPNLEMNKIQILPGKKHSNTKVHSPAFIKRDKSILNSNMLKIKTNK